MTTRRTLRARTPADLLALVPCVLGFHPEDSVVLLSLGDGRQVHARADLPRDESSMAELTHSLLVAVRRTGAPRVALVVYSDDHQVAFETVRRLESALEDVPAEVLVSLRADGERWYSLDCGDPWCCPVEGAPYDVAAHEFTAQRVLDGLVTFRSRQELADTLLGNDPDAVEAVADAAEQARRRLRASARHSRGPGSSAARRHHVTEGVWVRDRVRRYVESRDPLDADDAGRILVAMVEIEVRDVAWAQMACTNASAHIDLWRDLLRRAPVELAAAPAALLGLAAWLGGEGALAWCAVDRCQEAEPGYTLAGLISQALAAAVDPQTWTTIPTEELPLFTG